MRLLFTFIFSICIIGFACAQEVEAPADSTISGDSVIDQSTLSEDSVIIQNTFGIAAYVDYGKLATQWTDFESKLEFGVTIRITDWGFGFEYGTAELNPLRPYQNGDVYADGKYMGGYFIYYVPIDNKNSLFGGFGYYSGVYNEEITFTVESDLWDSYTETISRSDINASWATIRIGSEQKLNSFLYLGGVMELRIKTSLDDVERIESYSIPGYGKASNSISPAINVYFGIKL